MSALFCVVVTTPGKRFRPCIPRSKSTQIEGLKDKNISIDFAFVRGHTGVIGNERVYWLAKDATKLKNDITIHIPKPFYRKIMK
ncbi:hypothetical protein TNCV_480841 [Trichonephila clavipes]|nr:hypothetical protein TNCV_480841 [Trichonephila clavipes]